jgi:hypothetical protein
VISFSPYFLISFYVINGTAYPHACNIGFALPARGHVKPARHFPRRPMTLTKALLIFGLFVIAFNLFYYSRYKRVMAEVRRRLAEEEAAGDAPEIEDEKGD